jgi:hypothetical protein
MRARAGALIGERPIRDEIVHQQVKHGVISGRDRTPPAGIPIFRIAFRRQITGVVKQIVG